MSRRAPTSTPWVGSSSISTRQFWVLVEPARDHQLLLIAARENAGLQIHARRSQIEPSSGLREGPPLGAEMAQAEPSQPAER